MSQKELLYMEDAITHEDNLAIILTNFSSGVEDKGLEKFLKTQAKKHQNIKEKLLKVLEDITYEG